jgi:membrane dipeptidase
VIIIKYQYKICDAHCDTIEFLTDSKDDLKINDRHLSLEHMLKYEGYIQCFAAWIDREHENSLQRALNMFDAFFKEYEKNKDIMELVKDSVSLNSVLNSGKIGAMLTVEDARALCGDINNLYKLYDIGVRAMTLTWNHDNDICCGTFTENDTGLTSFGREVVCEMNKLGMIVDVSHLSRKSFWDVLNITKKPIMASHSNSYKIYPHPRNLDDEQIKAVIKNNGFIGINIYPDFIANKDFVSINDILLHIEHILSLGGESVLGLGTDFDGIPTLPCEIKNAGDLYRIFDKMKEKGYENSLIDKISHKNFLNFVDNSFKNEKI